MSIRKTVQTRYQLHDIIKNQYYGVEYQPIVCVQSGEVFAYEALARFYLPDGNTIAPDVAFELLHEDIELLCQAEFDLKYLQIDNAPKDYDLFVNIDSHAISDISKIESDPLVNLVSNKPHIVVELIENIDIHDAKASTILHTELKKRDVRTALDDIGSPHALTSLQLMMLVNYLKFDRMWVSNLHETKHCGLLESLLSFSDTCKRASILEGIETESMLETARSFSVDYVQGFLYKSKFKSVKL